MNLSYQLYVPIIYVYIPDQAYWCTPPPNITNTILNGLSSNWRETIPHTANATLEQIAESNDVLPGFNHSLRDVVKNIIIPKDDDGYFKSCSMYNAHLDDIEVRFLL